jgi:hypothetical protein
MAGALRSFIDRVAWAIPVLLLLLVGLTAYSRDRGPITTPQEFVRRYSSAHRAHDVRKICSMWADLRELEGRAGIQRAQRDVFDRRAYFLQRRALEHGLATDRLLYRAWDQTRYLSHQDHGEYLRVQVETMQARAEVVLVWQDGTLRLHPVPSWFE